MLFIPEVDSTFTVGSVKIGINFHWERQEKQTFRGELLLSNRRDGTFAVINRVRLEDYLLSVTSSEMSPEAPCEFLKAQAITSRSWLGAMLERRRTKKEEHNDFQISSDREILRWYDREEHDIYDVCAEIIVRGIKGSKRQAQLQPERYKIPTEYFSSIRAKFVTPVFQNLAEV